MAEPVAVNIESGREESASEPDLSDDEAPGSASLPGSGSGTLGTASSCFGHGLHGETQEEIQRIEQGVEAPYDPDKDGDKAPSGEEEGDKIKTRPTRSKYWKHFKQGPVQKDGTYFAICLYCGVRYLQGRQKGTSSMKNHITKQCKNIPRNNNDALQKMLQAAKDGEGTKIVAWVFDQMKCRLSLARMVIAHEYPFNCVSHFFFKVFLSDLQPSFKVPCRNTLKKDCFNVYEEGQVDLYQKLEELNCRFSFTSDLWTNKDRDRGFMAITCHFIDDNWKLCKRIVTFVPLPSPHTGQNIADAFFDKMVLWNLDKRVFCLVLDNASSNDACINALLTSTSLKNDLPCDGNIFHQRCGCHILNLIVQDGLKVLGDKISNIRDTMKYIRHSQGRMGKFRLSAAQAKIKYKKPNWDVPTRWNSTYMMLELALHLKPAICRYANYDKKFTYNPSEVEWQAVNTLVDELRIFYTATKRLSGTKYPTINLFFTEFCEVYLAIRNMASSPYPFVVQMGVEMITKFEKYWEISNAMLAMACTLDPRCKLHVVEYYIKQLFPREVESLMANLKVCLQALFKEYVESDQSQARPAKRQKTAPSVVSISTTKAGLKEYIQGKKISEPIKSELDDYLGDKLDEASVDEEFDILAWWKLKAPKYPVLSRIARDVLAVPISTVPSESAFSTSGRVLTPIRSSLTDESIEALMCAQDWLRASINERGEEFGDVLWSVDEVDGIGIEE